ncbi:pyridoxamine 5'-phosphate oxidase family protein [Candidatus Woesebacteria bacterium]|nr:pyridoxamine 5'-phosphate oxidase family protein [Candidatus Woesebacteria bacterium]
MSKKYTNDQIRNFMRSIGIMSASINAEPFPIATILLFALDDDFTLYFATHLLSSKSKALQAHPKFSFSVWEHHKMLVQGSGVATQITEYEEIERTLEKLAMSAVNIENFWPPVLQLDPDEYIIFKIKTTQMQVIPLESDTISSDQMSIQKVQL